MLRILKILLQATSLESITSRLSVAVARTRSVIVVVCFLATRKILGLYISVVNSSRLNF